MNRENFRTQYIQVNRKFEDRFFPLVKRAIHYKVEKTVAQLRHGGYDQAKRYLHMDLTNEKMTEVIQSLYVIVGRKHAQLNYQRLRDEKGFVPEMKGFGFNQQWADYIINYLKRHLLNLISIDISNTTRDLLLRTLTTMQMAGLSIDQAVDQLQDWPYERFQAARIVRTEVNRAANTGAKAQSETSDYWQMKEWIAIHDKRTRGNPITGRSDHANHWSLDGTKIDEGDVFIDPRNGDRLDFPGDPKASAASTINCRCSVAYTLKRDAHGNPIKKRRSTAIVYPNQVVRLKPVA